MQGHSVTGYACCRTAHTDKPLERVRHKVCLTEGQVGWFAGVLLQLPLKPAHTTPAQLSEKSSQEIKERFQKEWGRVAILFPFQT